MLPLMRRPGTVIGIAVVQLAGTAGCLGFALLALLGVLTQATNPEIAHRSTSAAIGGIGILIALSVWGLVTALGLLGMRVWGLVSTLVFAFFLLAGGIGAGAQLLMPVPVPDARLAAAVHAFELMIGLFLVGVGVWWVAYLVRAQTQASFFAARPGGQPPRQPVSIQVIAWLMLGFGGLMILLLPTMASRHVVTPLGFVVSGLGAQGVFLLVSAVGLVIGMGLLELRSWARMAAMAWIVLAMLYSMLILLTPASRMAMIPAGSMPELSLSPPLAYPAVIVALGVASGAVQIYFLWTRQGSFGLSTPPEPAPATAVNPDAAD